MVTPNGLFTANRVVIGSIHSVANAEQVDEPVIKPVLGKSVQVWLDSVLGYAKTEKKLLNTLDVVMQRCRDFGVKLYPREIHFSSEGISHCASRVQDLCELSPPKKSRTTTFLTCRKPGSKQHFKLHCAGSRTNKNLMTVFLRDHGWSSKQEACYKSIKELNLK